MSYKTHLHCLIDTTTLLKLKRMEVNVSEIVRIFLDNYVKIASNPTEVKKAEILNQLNNAQKLKEQAIQDITMAELRLQEFENKEKDRMLKEYDVNVKMNQAIKNSGLMEDLI